MRVPTIVSSIRGRIIGLVAFFLLVLLVFSLVMLHRNGQVELDIHQLLEVRTRIQKITERMKSVSTEVLSESRNSILKQTTFSGESEIELIKQEYHRIDSLKEHLGDTNGALMRELAERIEKVEVALYQADSIWTQYLHEARDEEARLYQIDPSTKTFRQATVDEQAYQLASDTLAEILIEAEDAYYIGAFLNHSHAGFQGRGYVDYTNKSEDFLEWKFSTSWSGKHAILLHYANGSTSDRPLSLRVDSVEIAANWAFPAAEQGNWTTWVDTDPLYVAMEAGVHTLRATAIGESGCNIDYLRVIAPAPHADSAAMNLVIQEQGTVDEKVIANMADQLISESRKSDVMNGVEDVLRIALTDVGHSIQVLVDQNEQLMYEDVTQLQRQLQKTNMFNFLTVGLVAILAAIATYLVIHSLEKSIEYPVQLIQRLSRGKTNLSIVSMGNELDMVVEAGQQLGERLNQASEFATEVGEGNLAHDFTPSGENDVLGNALVQMRDKLQAISEKDQKRNWQTAGLTKFADLLRKDYASRYELAACLISELAKYTGANQGGVFLYQEQEASACLQLTGCYAYDRRKYLKKEIHLGEGLLGQAYLEGETTYLSEVPDEYAAIRSGLGGANPTSLLIVSLKTEDKIEGVLELMSFREFADHEISLVEQVAKIIAAHVSSMRTNEKTQALLEETKLQAEQLRDQEEELRQNMEEIQATQEQMRRDTIQ